MPGFPHISNLESWESAMKDLRVNWPLLGTVALSVLLWVMFLCVLVLMV